MKSVIVFVRHLDKEKGTVYFTEATEFGDDCRYKSASEFVNALQDMYRKHGDGCFFIDNVVIG